jgi:hypothetical protein
VTGGHRDIGNGDDSFGGPRLEVGPDIPAAARLAGCAIDPDPLAIEVDVLDGDGDGFLPAQPSEGHDDGDVAEARLEFI